MTDDTNSPPEKRPTRLGRRPSANPKSISLSFRVTPFERDQLIDAAGGKQHVSRFMRSRIFGRPFDRPKEIPPVNREAWRDLAPVLSNLNQLTKHANQSSGIPPHQVQVLVDLLLEINREVGALRMGLLGLERGEVIAEAPDFGDDAEFPDIGGDHDR